MTSLAEHIEGDLIKLNRRLAKQGIPNVLHMEYPIYLRSTLWHKIRDWIYERDEHTCLVCRFKRPRPQWDGFDVHHKSYDLATLEGRDESQLVTLCRGCHNKVEHYPDGRKRHSLIEKEAELQRLTGVHLRLIEHGLPVRVETTVRRSVTSYVVTYTGPDEFRVFHSLYSLLWDFVLMYSHEHRDRLRIPMPFGHDKLSQPSGARVIEIATEKPIFIATCRGDSGIIKLTKSCAYPVYDGLLQFIEKKPYWRFENSPV